MKKIIKTLTIIAMLGSIVPALAQEYKTREVPNAPAFSAIEVSGGDVNVFFSQGEGYSFAVSGPAKLVKAIKIKVKENTLLIEYNQPFFTGDDDDVAVHVNAPALNRIVVSGEADFKNQTYLQGQDLTIKTRKNGEVSLKNVNISQVKIDAKGSSAVDIDYIEANKISISSLDRAEVEISGRTGQLDILNKGMFAEIDTKDLIATQMGGNTSANTQKVNKDGSVEFTFD
ncbi:MAG: DUF2807 domain-containing protein [Elusimicrobiaceae bacterium]|nr:DUF2807 domain-containing protein [Elusimicrobiaceae bacterium]